MELKQLLERSNKQLGGLTGLKPVAVTRVFKDEQGWHVGMEMLEMSRIPSATDILGEYEVLLNGDGEVVRFERMSTRLRGQPKEG